MEQTMYKNQLQEYTQKASIPIPIYVTINEGTPNMPRFRSTVYVDGTQYTCVNTFPKLKHAEQDVAKIAFQTIQNKPKEEAFPFLFQNTSLSKNILHEYAVKMKLGLPTFDTKEVPGLIAVFVSDLGLNGVTYTGPRAKSKKEAERLAAQDVISSILDSESKMTMWEIIKSKEKLYAMRGSVVEQKVIGYDVGDSGGNQSGLEMSSNKRKEPATPEGTTTISSLNASSAPAQPFHEFKKPNVETLTKVVIPYPITFVPPAHIPNEVLVSCSTAGKKKNSKKKKKSQQIVGGDTQKVESVMPLAQVPVMPLAQVPPCSAAQ